MSEKQEIGTGDVGKFPLAAKAIGELQVKRERAEVGHHHPPGGHLSPYIWRLRMRDGSTLVRGDSWKGKPLLTAHGMKGEDVQSIELLRANEGEKWGHMNLALEPGDVIEYARTQERCLELGEGPKGPDGKRTDKVAFEGCVAVRFGRVRLGGVREVDWLFADGRIVRHPGTYEEVVGSS